MTQSKQNGVGDLKEPDTQESSIAHTAKRKSKHLRFPNSKDLYFTHTAKEKVRHNRSGEFKDLDPSIANTAKNSHITSYTMGKRIEKSLRHIVDQYHFMYPSPQFSTRPKPKDAEKPGLKVPTDSPAPDPKTPHQSKPRLKQFGKDRVLSANYRRRLKKKTTIIQVVFGWILWELKNQGVQRYERLCRTYIKLHYKSKDGKCLCAFTAWEICHALGEMGQLLQWKMNWLGWHIKNIYIRSLISLKESGTQYRQRLHVQKKAIVEHQTYMEGLLKLYALLLLMKGVTSAENLEWAVRGSMIPFHVSAWVYGYWAMLYEEFMRREAKRRAAAGKEKMA